MESSWWKDLGQLDDEQKKVISLDDDADHLVIGPPGCGKTNLLLLRASYLHKKGTTNIKVLAFGRVLKEFIASGTAHYPFAPDKVQTFMRWAYEVLSANGLALTEDDDFDKVRDQMFARLGEVAAMQKPENIYDLILLDEAQDYSADEVNLIRSFGERIFAVGDNPTLPRDAGSQRTKPNDVTLAWPDFQANARPIICVSERQLQEFFAFVSTYSTNVRPFTAYFRVLPVELIGSLERIGSSRGNEMQVARMVAGASLAEAWMAAARQAERPTYVLPLLQSSLSLVLGQTVLAGYDDRAFDWALNEWIVISGRKCRSG